MRVRVGSRGSGLAVLQARKVGEAVSRAFPDVAVEYLTRTSQGDRDRSIALWQSAEKGLFTSDLSQLLLSREVELVVHSWKDLPVEPAVGTVVAGTLPRADARDVLLIRPEVVRRGSPVLTVLTSSPRRAWQLTRSLAPLLPWAIDQIEVVPVRGNVPTRLQKLLAGEGDALVMAKAALDRMLAEAEPAERAQIKVWVNDLQWMVLPLREFPTAPAQGALAIEVAADRNDIRELVTAISDESAVRVVEQERRLLAAHGGGCHEAIGVTILDRPYGTIVSARGRLPDGAEFEEWSLKGKRPAPPPAEIGRVWPRPDERDQAVRRRLPVELPSGVDGWWVARADAVPEGVSLTGAFVWAAGPRTWQKLAERGIWVHGSSEGLGDTEEPAIELLAGRPVAWRRLTHARSDAPDAVATYDVDLPLPDDMAARTHFFWTSGSAFREAVARHPGIESAWHGCGPGRTFRTLHESLGDTDRLSVWLGYEQWLEEVTR